ncbi:chymotrypsin-2-like [Diorhabda carinulata]|uniref:chymotrypsin-2-like n=1 Tax=Diorhabda carinulata TaxID=1163345 RepID=UPI0025A187A0|nr:chymotrypsin-2-like [Diorhabda carinulata]
MLCNALILLCIVYKIVMVTGTPINTRMVGGEPCDKEYLYMASLRPMDEINKHVCAGTLINPNWILTAAHCYMGWAVAIIGNKYNLLAKVDENDNNRLVVDIFYMVVHPNYNELTKTDDIALAFLSQAVNFIDSVKLPRVNHGATLCKLALVIGWGYQHENVPLLSSILQCVFLKTMNYVDCHRKNAICTFTKDKDACKGDSGGPLLCGDVQFGIVSRGKGCQGRYPGIYTRVDKYLDFIEKHAISYRSSSRYYKIRSSIMILFVFIQLIFILINL